MFRKLINGLVKMAAAIAFVAAAVSIVVPVYQKALMRRKEAALRRNLFGIRTGLHQYTYDKRRGPRELSDLVKERYLTSIPVDPITRSARSWLAVEDGTSGVSDVHSGSNAISLEGTAYLDW